MSEITAPANQPEVRSFLGRTLLARMGTANPRTMQPHVTPVWFEWDGECVWISAFNSTRKVKDLQKNQKVSILVDTGGEGNPTQAVLFEGTAVLITDSKLVMPRAESIYTRYLGPEGVKAKEPQSWLTDPENTIIQLAPERVFVWGF